MGAGAVWESLQQEAGGHTGRLSAFLDVPGAGWSPGWPQGTAGLIQAPN